MAEAVEQFQTMKFVYDLSEVTRTDLASHAWFTTTYLPRNFSRYGSHFNVAIVRSKNRFENVTSKVLAMAAMRLGMRGQVRFFSTLVEAEAWIDTVKSDPPRSAKRRI